MKLDGNAVCYILSQRFEDVVSYLPARSPIVDYPRLYDEADDMSGHTVFVPENVLLDKHCRMQDVVCVCVGEKSARAAVEAGYPVIHVRDAVSEQHLFNGMQADHVNHERLDARLRAYLDTHAGFAPLLDACARAMGCSFALVDNRFKIMAQADQRSGSASTWLEGALDEDDFDLFMASPDYGRMRQARYVFSLPEKTGLLMKNIFAGNEVVCSLFVAHERTIEGERYARFLLEYLAPFVEEMFVRLGSFGLAAEEEMQVRAALSRAFNGDLDDCAMLDQILAGHADAQETANLRFVVLCFERSFTNEGAEGLGYLAHRIELAWPQSYVIVEGDTLYALLNTGVYVRNGGADIGQRLAQFARDALVKIGISRQFSSSVQLEAARMQSMAALAQGNIDDPMFWLYRFDDYALNWLMRCGRGSYPPEYFCHSAILELLRYDEEHGSELVHTLSEFIESRYNATAAAQKLFVARSTLLNRLDRIVELVQIDLDDFDERMYLALSLKALRDSAGWVR